MTHKMSMDFGKRLANIVGQDRVDELNQIADIAAQITKARHSKKMSQQKLADEIGVAKSTIGRIEAGLTHPNTTTLYKISKVLNVPFIIDGATQIDKKLVKN